MTEKQLEAIAAGTAIGAVTGVATGLATAGILSGSLAIKGGIIGGVGGATGGPIYGYFSHKAALKTAEEAVTKREAALAAKEKELSACISLQAANAIKPIGFSVSIRYSPTHSIDISTNDPIKRIHLYITPVDSSIAGNTVTAVTEKDGGFSEQISHTFSTGDYKGTYNVEVTVEFFRVEKHGPEDKTFYGTWQINVSD